MSDPKGPIMEPALRKRSSLDRALEISSVIRSDVKVNRVHTLYLGIMYVGRRSFNLPVRVNGAPVIQSAWQILVEAQGDAFSAR